MSRTRRLAPAALVLVLAAVLGAALAACGSGANAGPWLTMPSPEAHFAKFPMGLESSHAVCTDCNDCHRERVSPGAAWTPSASFKAFTCIGCHYTSPGVPHSDQAALTQRHAAANVVGFEYTDAACLRCHPGGIAVDHAARFPLPHRNAAGTIVAVCSSCHVDPANRKTMGCAGCHPHDQAPTAAAHARVPEFAAADSGLCLRCHADGTVDRIAAHTQFPIAAGAHAAATVKDGISGGACLRCHPATLTTAPRTYAADFSRYVCLGCHVQVRPGVWHDSAANLATLHDAGTSITDATCYGCHKDGAGGAPANHPQLFPIGSTSAHKAVTCGQCHTSSNRADLAALGCASCHNGIAGFSTKHATVVGAAILVTTGTTCTTAPLTVTSPTCLKCHGDSQVDRVRLHPGGSTGFGVGAHVGAGCLTCHLAARADKPFAVDFSRPNPASQGSPGCATCHNNGCGGD